MTNVASLARIAALIGEPARAAMLLTLMDGRALTAGELAEAAGVMPSTGSGHLGTLLNAGLLALERQGRHRYYRLASTSVAEILESMMSFSEELSAVLPRCKPIWTGPRDRALRRARVCYDHLAGEIAVEIAGSMTSRGYVHLGQDGGMVTDQGLAFFASLGVDCGPNTLARSRATFCRPCLDWSERRPHIAGTIGRRLYEFFVRQAWLRQLDSGRAVSITPRGVSEFNRYFGIAAA